MIFDHGTFCYLGLKKCSGISPVRLRSVHRLILTEIRFFEGFWKNIFLLWQTIRKVQIHNILAGNTVFPPVKVLNLGFSVFFGRWSGQKGDGICGGVWRPLARELSRISRIGLRGACNGIQITRFRSRSDFLDNQRVPKNRWVAPSLHYLSDLKSGFLVNGVMYFGLNGG